MALPPLVGLPTDRKQIGLHPFLAVGEKYVRAVVDGAGAFASIAGDIDNSGTAVATSGANLGIGNRSINEAFLEQRLATCDEAPASLRTTGDEHLLGLVGFWRERLERLRALFERLDGDVAGAFRHLAERGRIELISSAATHGYLPLLGREESIRLQLLLGAA